MGNYKAVTRDFIIQPQSKISMAIEEANKNIERTERAQETFSVVQINTLRTLKIAAEELLSLKEDI